MMKIGIFSRIIFSIIPLFVAVGIATPAEIVVKSLFQKSEIVEIGHLKKNSETGVSSIYSINSGGNFQYPITSISEQLFVILSTNSSRSDFSQLPNILLEGLYNLGFDALRPDSESDATIDFQQNLQGHDDDIDHTFRLNGKHWEAAHHGFAKKIQDRLSLWRITRGLNVPIFGIRREVELFCDQYEQNLEKISNLVRNKAEISLKNNQIIFEQEKLNSYIDTTLKNYVGWNKHDLESPKNNGIFRKHEYDPFSIFLLENCIKSIAKEYSNLAFKIPKTKTYEIYSGMPVGLFLIHHIFDSKSVGKLFQFNVIHSRDGLNNAKLLLDEIDRYLNFLSGENIETSLDSAVKILISEVLPKPNSVEKIRAAFLQLRRDIIVAETIAKLKVGIIVNLDPLLHRDELARLSFSRLYAVLKAHLNRNYRGKDALFYSLSDSLEKLQSEFDLKKIVDETGILAELRSPATGYLGNEEARNAVGKIASWVTKADYKGEILKSLHKDDISGTGYEIARQSALNDEALVNLRYVIANRGTNQDTTEVWQALQPVFHRIMEALLLVPKQKTRDKLLAELVQNIALSFKSKAPSTSLDSALETFFIGAFGDLKHSRKLMEFKTYFLTYYDKMLKTLRPGWYTPHLLVSKKPAVYAENKQKGDLVVEAFFEKLAANIKWAGNPDSVPSIVTTKFDEVLKFATCYHYDRFVAGPGYKADGLYEHYAYQGEFGDGQQLIYEDILDVKFAHDGIIIGSHGKMVPKNSLFPCLVSVSTAPIDVILKGRMFINSRSSISKILRQFSNPLLEKELGLLKHRAKDFQCKPSNTLVGTYVFAEMRECLRQMKNSLSQWVFDYVVSIRRLQLASTTDLIRTLPQQFGSNTLVSSVPFHITPLVTEPDQTPKFKFSAIGDYVGFADLNGFSQSFGSSKFYSTIMYQVSDETWHCLGSDNGEIILEQIDGTKKDTCLRFPSTAEYQNDGVVVKIEGSNLLNEVLTKYLLDQRMNPIKRHVLRRYATLFRKDIQNSRYQSAVRVFGRFATDLNASLKGKYPIKLKIFEN